MTSGALQTHTYMKRRLKGRVILPVISALEVGGGIAGRDRCGRTKVNNFHPIWPPGMPDNVGELSLTSATTHTMSHLPALVH